MKTGFTKFERSITPGHKGTYTSLHHTTKLNVKIEQYSRISICSSRFQGLFYVVTLYITTALRNPVQFESEQRKLSRENYVSIFDHNFR